MKARRAPLNFRAVPWKDTGVPVTVGFHLDKLILLSSSRRANRFVSLRLLRKITAFATQLPSIHALATVDVPLAVRLGVCCGNGTGAIKQSRALQVYFLDPRSRLRDRYKYSRSYAKSDSPAYFSSLLPDFTSNTPKVRYTSIAILSFDNSFKLLEQRFFIIFISRHI